MIVNYSLLKTKKYIEKQVLRMAVISSLGKQGIRRKREAVSGAQHSDSPTLRWDD